MPDDRNSQLPSGQLEINENLAFQRHIWRFQRIGWLSLALIVTLALAGAAGGGGLLSDSVETRSRGILEYQRVLRTGHQAALAVTSRDRPLTIHFPMEFLRDVQLIDVASNAGPVELRAESGMVVIRPDPGPVVIPYQGRKAGIVRTSLTINGEPFPMTFAVLP